MPSTHAIRPVFAGPYEEYDARKGQPFQIVGMVWYNEEDGINPEPSFTIRFPDGLEIEARAEEIFSGWDLSEEV